LAVADQQRRLTLFARFPVAGKVKTRLIPALGAEDAAALTSDVLAAAFDLLKNNPVVFGPATDGGYYLVGLTKLVPELFQSVTRGTETVLAKSLQILERTGIRPAQRIPLDDLDRLEDLASWRRIVEPEDADLSRVSVIIPALNEAAHIGATLQSVCADRPHEIILVDGGSTDDTRASAEAAGATVIQSKPGRARQMNVGAARATGNVLLFLHADTLLPNDWTRIGQESLGQPGVVAGSFGFRIAEQFAGRRLVEWTTNLRARKLARFYRRSPAES